MSSENNEYLFIHLDLKSGGHNIPLEDSIKIDQSILGLVKGINKEFFQNQLEIEILSSPPNNGSHLKKTIIKVVGCIVIIDQLLSNSDGANAILKVITGKEYSEHIESNANYLKNIITGVLEKDSQELLEAGISPQLFYDIYNAKNQFYRTALNNPNIIGIGFNTASNFPISRNSFARRIMDLSKEDKGIPPIEKYHELRIVAPITTHEDKKLAWKVKDKNQDIVFSAYIKDDDFYDSFLENHFYISSMLVRVKYTFMERAGHIYTKKEITKVFRYNDINLCPLPDDIVIDPAPVSSIEINNKHVSLDNDDTENHENPQMSLLL